ncbi:MAG: lasso peptide biosynthesis B2 protein [Bacteroidota bacterium]
MPQPPDLHVRRPIRRITALEAAFLLWSLALIPITLRRARRMPLPALVRAYDAAPRISVPPTSVDRFAQLLNGLFRRIRVRDYCMPASLILFRWVRRCGQPASIVFGVARKEDDLHGHAWVELDGRALGESTDPRNSFQVTFSYPDEGRAG